MAAGNRRDAGTGAGDHFAGGEHAGVLRGKQDAVDGKQSALGEEQVRAGDDVCELGSLADGEYDDVGCQIGEVLGELGREATLSVEDRQAALHTHAGDVAILGKHRVRSPRAVGHDTLVDGFFDLPRVGRKLVHGLERGEHDLGRADAQGHARAVHRDVAAADDQDALAFDAGVALPVAGLEKVECADYPLGIVTGNRQNPALLESCRDQHGIVLADEVVHRNVSTDRHVETQLHAHGYEIVDLLLEDVAGKPIRWHA